MLQITNTLTGKKEEFKPLVNDQVTLYVCGVTPYDKAHLGHGRVYVMFDVLYRLLQFLGYKVIYCRNITDIDDKLLKKAEVEFGDKQQYKKVADKFIHLFNQELQQLQCKTPDHEPRVTENMPEIITFISELVKKGHAYQVEGNVYFHIPSFSSYGKLSKHKVQDLRAGQRIKVDERKKDPLDFALWKAEGKGTFFESPWGAGRPGWHIECSALAKKCLGPQIDIHAGGRDLIFPHHENEIAQSEALHEKLFANYWMHIGLVQINKEKMSKSLGNFFTLEQILNKFDPMVLRYYFLTHHYKSPLDFSLDDLQAAQKSYQKLIRTFENIKCSETISYKEIQDSPVVLKMLDFLLDDLNTPGMFGVLFVHLDFLQNNQKQACLVKSFLSKILGLELKPLPQKEIEITQEIQKLLAQREKARAEKDYKKADEIRDKLRQLGFDIQDKKNE